MYVRHRRVCEMLIRFFCEQTNAINRNAKRMGDGTFVYIDCLLEHYYAHARRGCINVGLLYKKWYGTNNDA